MIQSLGEERKTPTFFLFSSPNVLETYHARGGEDKRADMTEFTDVMTVLFMDTGFSIVCVCDLPLSLK